MWLRLDENRSYVRTYREGYQRKRDLSVVNNLRTDKTQALGGCKQHKPQLTVHETGIAIARLADFGCVCVYVCLCASSEVCESLSVVFILRFSIEAGIVTEIRTQ
jgi:hypothetical protein